MIPELATWSGVGWHLPHHRAHIWHTCYHILLKSIKQIQRKGTGYCRKGTNSHREGGVTLYNAATKRWQNFLPLLAQFQSDIPEKHLATLVQPRSAKPCWKCLVPDTQLLSLQVDFAYSIR